MRLPLLSLLALSTVALACGDSMHDTEKSCTAMGCNSGVFWDTTGWTNVVKDGDPATPVELCLGDVCKTLEVTRKNGAIDCTGGGGGDFPFAMCLPYDGDHVGFQLLVSDKDAAISGSGANVRLKISQLGLPKQFASTEVVKSTQPNGAGCEPTCRQINVTLDVSKPAP